MVFSSAAFLFVFFPLTWLAHLIIPGIRRKNTFLLTASLLFYAVSSLMHLPLLLLVIAVSYGSGKAYQKWPEHKKTFLILALAIELGLLIVFKYLHFFIGEINSLCGLSLPLPALTLPVGISFFTFQAVSYSVDVYRKPDAGADTMADAALYLSFFPQLIAGPIVKYRMVSEQLRHREPGIGEMAQGCRRFILGLSKKLLIADVAALAADRLYSADSYYDGRIALAAMISYGIQIYFDFSGYSDMAIGMGRMFGFRFPENFNFPYAASSVRDFWRRWHISLTDWFREYVYIPLGGSRRGRLCTVRNIGIVFLLTGVWHGAAWTFILWGVWHGLWSVMERITPLKKLSGTAAGHLYALAVAVLGFGLFRADSLSHFFNLCSSLLCWSGFSGEATLLLRQAMSHRICAALVIGAVLASGIPQRFYQRHRRTFSPFLYPVSLGMLLLCLMHLASSSFNPFIYFQF